MGLKKIFALWLALGILVFVSCKQNLDSETILVNVQGTWEGDVSWGEKYEIAPEYFKSNGSYEGSTTYIRFTSDDSGYIYFKYTKAMNSDYSYSETAPDVGKWYCVAFKNLKENSISISGAYKASTSGGKTSTTTLEEAIAEFTVENEYFAMYSECVRK